MILPSATYRAPDFLAAARELGVVVTVASERRAAMSAAMGERALTLRLSDPAVAAEQIAERARETPFAAVVGVDDQGVMAAALGAERLGLPHNPPAAVARTRDKAAMRRALAEAGVPQPRFALLPCGADVAAVAREVGLPCVVKPLGLSGSRGVIRADDAEQARSTAERVRGILAAAQEPPGAPLLLESYLPGVEVAIEGLLRGGRLEVLAVFDKPDPLEGPYFEETLYVTPSRLPTAVLAEVESVTARAARALGLREGPIHAELRVDGERRERARAGGPVDRRPVLARAALRRRRQPRAGDPAPRAGTRARGPGAGVDGVGGDDDPDPRGWRAARGRGAGSRRGRWRASAGWRSRSPAAARWCRCPTATATWASCSRARRAPTRSNAACALRTLACGSGSSRTRPSRSARASVGHPCASC